MFDTLGLFEYQEADVRRIAEAFRRVRRVLYTLPTGGGKTHVAVAHVIAARRRDERVLFLAHRRELVNQAAKRLERAGVPRETIGIIMSDDRRSNASAPVQVASIDTIRRRSRPESEFVIVDECHRALAPTYRKLLAMYPEAKVLGLTATPFRLDGRGLGAEFDELVIGCSPAELIAHGQLVTSRVFTVPDELLPVLSDVRVVAGDYDASQLGRVMNRRPLVAGIVQEYRRLGENRAAVVFSSGREHARVIQAEFAAAGYVAEYLDGDTPLPERDAMLARLRDGGTRVVVNCDVLVEGWDAPWVKCVVLARPTRSLGRYLQMVGRVLRRYQGETALVLDHAGNALVHGLPDEDRREWLTLDTRKHAKGEATAARGKRCPQCGVTVGTGTRSCAECGYEWPVEEVPETVVGELVEVPTYLRSYTCENCGGPRSYSSRSGLCRRCVKSGGRPSIYDHLRSDVVNLGRSNLSARQILQRLGIRDGERIPSTRWVLDVLAEAGFPPRRPISVASDTECPLCGEAKSPAASLCKRCDINRRFPNKHPKKAPVLIACKRGCGHHVYPDNPTGICRHCLQAERRPCATPGCTGTVSGMAPKGVCARCIGKRGAEGFKAKVPVEQRRLFGKQSWEKHHEAKRSGTDSHDAG